MAECLLTRRRASSSGGAEIGFVCLYCVHQFVAPLHPSTCCPDPLRRVGLCIPYFMRTPDLLDLAFIALLCNSTDPFISKLVSGLSLAMKRHTKDETTIVQAQVPSRSLRQPTPIPTCDGSLPEQEHTCLDPMKSYSVATQTNHNLSEIMANMNRTQLWTVSCI